MLARFFFFKEDLIRAMIWECETFLSRDADDGDLASPSRKRVWALPNASFHPKK